MRLGCILGVAALLVGVSEGARILGLLGMPSRSHGILMERLLRQLASRGHQITYITGSTQMTQSSANLTIIYVPGIQEVIMPPRDTNEEFNMLQSLGKMNGPLKAWFIFLFTLAGPKMCDHILKQPEVQEIIKSDDKYDLILAEAFLDEALIAGFAYRFNAPIVGVMAFMPNIWGNYLVGNPAQSSYIPDPNLGVSSKMTFGERLYNFVFTSIWDFYHPQIYLAAQDKVVKQYFGQDAPDIRGILLNTSLLLVNHHHALGFPRPYLPNMVEVAGMHINPVKPLPADLKKYLDDSKQGAILFSMGSNIKSTDLPPEAIAAILKAFERLPYNILWKFEADLPNLPKNVKIGKWLPQSDILAHPNLKLFITHGGLLSTTEAVHRGVPVLGIPIFGDQPLNMKHTENAGLGKSLDFQELGTQDKFYESIIELTTNPRYMAAAKLRSAVLRDEMASPLEKAIWWVEYVLRHNGAAHLRSTAQSLTYYQLHQLDVIAVLVLVALAATYTNFLILRALFRKCCGSKQTSATKSTKKTVKKNN